MRRRCLLPPLIAAAVWAVSLPAAEAAPRFNIYVEHTAVYEVSYEALAETGLAGPAPSAGIGLRNLGVPVPRWIDDGGDGVFGPGDRLRFIGETLRGDVSYLDPHSRFNCYVLDFDDPEPLAGVDQSAAIPAGTGDATLLVDRHLEHDSVMVRFRATRAKPEEVWYWARLSVGDREPFVLRMRAGAVTGADGRTFGELRVDGGDPPAPGATDARPLGEIDTGPVRLRVGLRGWSVPRHREHRSLPHHVVEIALNGEVVGTAVWDGSDHFVTTIEVPFDRFVGGANRLALRVPRRVYPESNDLLVDVVLLNWIELEYEHGAAAAPGQIALRVADPATARTATIQGRDGAPVEVYLASGSRGRGDGGSLTVELADGDDELHVVGTAGPAAPDAIYLDRPSRLRGNRRQVDYVMITHSRLHAETERLADFHRSRGLAVAVVDVQDIYDEFNHGVLDPLAIKRFLQHAAVEWPAPAPRFVLLVGDASWDFKNATADDANYADWTYRPRENVRFVKNRSTPYEVGAEWNDRNLVPTTSYPTSEGHAASDTWFVCFDDGDELPDMAIGRIPVVEPDELAAVVDKTIAFVSSPPLGPWRRNLLFIANESASFQRRSDSIAEHLGRRGFAPTRIYPHPSEPANEQHTARIVDGFDRGVSAVHFLGHGGRYIWRTGPPDLEKNHDLFTLDHLDGLAGNSRMPVVLSLTCYSAPFDHPTADSIGEKLLRIPGRGAIAVFAASWRNSPSSTMGRVLLDELTTPGNTIGESIMRAKREFRSQMLVQTYNLLGDPAVPVAAPMYELDTRIEAIGERLRLSASIPEAVQSGTLVGDWLDADGAVLSSVRLPVSGSSFELELDRTGLDEAARPSAARVYVWDEGRRIDGIGWAAAEGDDADDNRVAAAAGPGTPGGETAGLEDAGGGDS